MSGTTITKRFQVKRLPRSLILITLLMVSTVIAVVRSRVADNNTCVRILTKPFSNLRPIQTSLKVFDVEHLRLSTTLYPFDTTTNTASPDQQHLVYWDEIGQTETYPFLKGLYLRSAGRNQLLTTIESPILSDMVQRISFSNTMDLTFSSWSRDSQYLAYVGFEPDGVPYLGIASINGDQPHRLDIPKVPDMQLALYGWSADDQYLAFVVRSGKNDAEFQIWRVGEDTTRSALIKVDIPLTAISWTPTGHELVALDSDVHEMVSDNEEYDYDYRVVLWSPEVGIESEVYVGIPYYNHINLEWSPDGHHLIVNNSDWHGGEYHNLIAWTPSMLDGETGQPNRTLTTEGIGLTTYRVVMWLDNGDALVSFRDDRDFTSALLRLNMRDNRDEVILTNLLAIELAPDGRRAAFTYEQDERKIVEIIDSAGNRQRLLALTSLEQWPLLYWTNDGQYLAIVTEAEQQAIILDTTQLDEAHRWQFDTINFAWIKKDWVIYLHGTDMQQVINLMHLPTRKTYSLGEGDSSLHVHALDAALSPDEQTIVVRTGDEQLTFINLADGNRRIINSSPLEAIRGVSFIYNGSNRYIYYHRDRTNLMEQLAWSSDGTKIAYLSSVPRGSSYRDVVLRIESPDGKLSHKEKLDINLYSQDTNTALAWGICN